MFKKFFSFKIVFYIKKINNNLYPNLNSLYLSLFESTIVWVTFQWWCYCCCRPCYKIYKTFEWHMNDDVIVAAGHATKYIKHLSDIWMMMLLLLQAMLQNIYNIWVTYQWWSYCCCRPCYKIYKTFEWHIGDVIVVWSKDQPLPYQLTTMTQDRPSSIDRPPAFESA